MDRMDRKKRLIEIFCDTEEYMRTDLDLAYAVASECKRTRLYEEEDYPELPDEANRTGLITVSRGRTFECATKLIERNPGKKVAVLNFASATGPGGGVTHGSGAQEESLCRCSTLYPSLKSMFLWENYYLKNREKRDYRYSDACIYTPDVIIIKSDTDYPERLPKEQWKQVDVITCAAPNLKHADLIPDPETDIYVPMLPADLRSLHEKRARHILTVAAANHVDILVLGAFGCGAFFNDPWQVAAAYRTVLAEFRTRFDQIDFAIYCRDYEMENYIAFRDVFQ